MSWTNDTSFVFYTSRFSTLPLYIYCWSSSGFRLKEKKLIKSKRNKSNWKQHTQLQWQMTTIKSNNSTIEIWFPLLLLIECQMNWLHHMRAVNTKTQWICRWEKESNEFLCDQMNAAQLQHRLERLRVLTILSEDSNND